MTTYFTGGRGYLHIAEKRGSGGLHNVATAIDVERLDSDYLGESNSRDHDGCLVAANHVERVDSAQVHKGRVRYFAPNHARIVQPCARVATTMNEVRVDDAFAPPTASPIRHIYRARCWKSRSPCPATAVDNRICDHLGEVHDSLTKFLTDKLQCVMNVAW